MGELARGRRFGVGVAVRYNDPAALPGGAQPAKMRHLRGGRGTQGGVRGAPEIADRADTGC